MYLVAILAVGLGVLILGILRLRRLRRHRDMERHSIDSETLHLLMEQGEAILLFDVRLPLDVLAYSEMIPGARRVPPKEIERNNSVIPRDRDVIVYCTCAGESTSRKILMRARSLDYSRIRFLKGGLDGWKAKGYPVVPYKESFRLDTA